MHRVLEDKDKSLEAYMEKFRKNIVVARSMKIKKLYDDSASNFNFFNVWKDSDSIKRWVKDKSDIRWVDKTYDKLVELGRIK